MKLAYAQTKQEHGTYVDPRDQPHKYGVQASNERCEPLPGQTPFSCYWLGPVVSSEIILLAFLNADVIEPRMLQAEVAEYKLVGVDWQ